jgi:hypothetical protein
MYQADCRPLAWPEAEVRSPLVSIAETGAWHRGRVMTKPKLVKRSSVPVPQTSIRSLESQELARVIGGRNHKPFVVTSESDTSGG